MLQQQLRTIHLGRNSANDTPVSQVLIAAVGVLQSVEPGRTIRDTLAAAGINPPTNQQTLRVNTNEVKDLGTVLKPGDKVTITNRVTGG